MVATPSDINIVTKRNRDFDKEMPLYCHLINSNIMKSPNIMRRPTPAKWIMDESKLKAVAITFCTLLSRLLFKGFLLPPLFLGTCLVKYILLLLFPSLFSKLAKLLVLGVASQNIYD